MKAKEFFDYISKEINFYCGVPDSLLKDFCAYLTDYSEDNKHIITANEGNAIALACGNYLATQKPALVYMQNSGTGNCINPLLSLADAEVYNIPILMLVGWRGEPKIQDEPQHKKQGQVTSKIFDVIEVKHDILEKDFDKAKNQIDFAFKYMQKTKKPYALIVQKGTFDKYISKKNKKRSKAILSREEALNILCTQLKDDDIIISTTGQLSRELYEYRENNFQSHKKDFLTVGSMGHASSIALGIALAKPERNIFCLDGDGAAIMHLGAIPVLASSEIKNLKHIIFNNEAHDSVGGQATCANKINFTKLAQACGYKNTFCAINKKELKNILPKFLSKNDLSLLEIKVKCGARENLGRPKESPIENKESFMEFLRENKTFLGENSVKNLHKILKMQKVKKAIIFTGKNSFENIKKIISNELKEIETIFYNNFSPNPKAEEIEKAIKILPNNYDIILAIGGGSVIDFAKIFKLCSDNKINIRNYIKTKIETTKKHKLIAIPTTAGTGAEATKFAVVYVDGEKNSIETQDILPDFAIIDSNFILNIPRAIKASCALDAFCQGLEAFWSINSTKESDEFAQKSIELCNKNLLNYVNLNDKEAAKNMALASNLAGKAINIAKTTAAHALSYTITSIYGIPHGAAVCLSIAKLAQANYEAKPENVTDKRGAIYLKNKMQKLAQILEISTEDFSKHLVSIIEKAGLEYKISNLGIENVSKITDNVNANRLKNNPVKFSQQELNQLFFTN